MKKARILLAGIAVMAVVGGALAFKARHQATFYSLNADGTSCNLPTQSFSTTTINGGVVFDFTTIASPKHAPDANGNVCGPIRLKDSN
jgi:hypothetical protein